MSGHPAGGAQTPLFTRRMLGGFALLFLVWSAVAWGLSNWLVGARVTSLIAAQREEANHAIAGISENFERVLTRLQGLAAVLGMSSDVGHLLRAFEADTRTASLPREARREEWSRRPEVVATGRLLLAAALEMDVDVIWVMNASGDCVTASNVAERTSFVGTNYADRRYFLAAQTGDRGVQYAMGRVTNVPGLFFSAPVKASGGFLGAVALKIDLPKLAPWVSHRHAFVTDEFGVIILAADRDLEMRALPGAPVHQLADAERLARYKRTTFETFGVEGPFEGMAPELARVSGSAHPHVVGRAELGIHGLTMHLMQPLTGIGSMRNEAFGAFVLLWLSGAMLIVLVTGARLYFQRMREHRRAIEASNESLRRLNEHLDQLAKVDSLTGTANRRHFQECLTLELARADRHGRDCSLILMDLDHFKAVNDTYGHAGGDEVLQHLARTVRGQLRKQDLLGRIGGEEFAVLLPETKLAAATHAAERIRRAVEAAPAEFDDQLIQITASLGVASRAGGGETADRLMQRADAALYEAKESGRNAVRSAGYGAPANPQDRAVPVASAAR